MAKGIYGLPRTFFANNNKGYYKALLKTDIRRDNELKQQVMVSPDDSITGTGLPLCIHHVEVATSKMKAML